MRLTGTTHSIELITSAATSVDWHVAFNNITATDSTALDGQGKITTATTTSIVAAPAASEQRQVVNLIVSNNGTAANDITIQKNVGGTLYPLYKVTLAAGENLQFSPNMGFRVNDAQGRDKMVTADSPPITARTIISNRISGTPAEAAGIRYWPNKDNGFPAAFVPGTPGLSGRAVVGTNAAARPLREVADPEAFLEASRQVMAAQFPLYVERWYPGERIPTVVLDGEVVAAWPLGSPARELLPTLPPAWTERCVAAARALGLRFCGVEAVSPDLHDLGASPILRLDANPELDGLAAAGPEPRARVVRIYQRLLASTEALLQALPHGRAPS